MHRVLVIGGTGNIGTSICRRLRQEEGVELTTVVRTRSAASPAGEIVGDVTDAHFVQDLLQRHTFDTIIHAAAPPYNPAAYRDRQFETFERDLTGLLRVLTAAQTVSKIVYLSSATVYEHCQELPFPESCTDRCAPPSSPVGLAKAAGERAIKLWSAQTGHRFTIWRLFNVVSPLEPHEVPGAHVQIDFYRKLIVEQQPALEILGSGAQVRCFTWVEDVANAVVDFLRDPRTDNQTFNLGGDEPRTLLELKDALLEAGKRRGLLPATYEPAITTGGTFFGVEAEQRVPSLEYVYERLGWRPHTSFAACIDMLVAGKHALQGGMSR